MNKRTKSGEALTELILEVFKTHGELIAAGNRVAKPHGLTAARWQIMGAIELAGRAMTVAQIARRMGLARQGVQRIINELEQQKLICAHDNIDHKRARLFALTRQGKVIMTKIDEAQIAWVNQLANGLVADQIGMARQLLGEIRKRSHI